MSGNGGGGGARGRGGSDRSSTPSKWKKLLHRRLPISCWLPHYSKDKAISDMIAGLTVGLTVMPQGLAYASIAGLETQYGLYSAFMGCFIYALFGGCKDITIGPTALMSLMTYQQVVGRNADYAVLLCFLTGCVMTMMAPLKLGILVEFISEPVTVGFTSATSIIIVASQLKGLFGLSFSSSGFIDNLYQVAVRLPNLNIHDTILGCSCIVILLGMRKLKDIPVVDKLKPTRRQKVIAKTLWLIGLSRNALVVLICSVVAFFLKANLGESPITLTGNVTSGLPPFRLPPFSTELNGTAIGFSEMLSDLGSSIAVVPVIAVLGNVAIAKAFATGGGLDASQELLTLGMSNLLGSFVSSMPVTGSFSRSAVNHASGVSTPLGGVYTGAVILLALGVLTPYFYYIPKASLAAVIITAVIFMIEYEAVKPMWKSSKKELIPLLVTFIVCLVQGVEHGILAGVLVNLVLMLAHYTRPKIDKQQIEVTHGVEYTMLSPAGCLFCPGVEALRKQVTLAATRSDLPIVLNCNNMRTTDYSTAKELKSMISQCRSKNRCFFFYMANEDVLGVLEPICGKDLIHTSSQAELHSRILDHHKIGNEENLNQVVTEELKTTSIINGNTRIPYADQETGNVDEPLLASGNGKTPRIVSSAVNA